MAKAPTTGGSANQTDQVRNELAGDAERLKDTATHKAEEKAREGKQQVRKTAEATTSAMQTAADELRKDDNAPEWLANAVSSAARQLGELAEQLNDTSPREMVQTTSRFARDHPGSFLTASAALGFAAARVLRAGADYKSEHDQGGSSYDGQSNARYAAGSTGTYSQRPSGISGAGASTTGTARKPVSTTTSTTTTTGRTGYGDTV